MAPSNSPSTPRPRQAPPPRGPSQPSPTNTRTKPSPPPTSRLHQPPATSSKPNTLPANSAAPPDGGKKPSRLPPIGAHAVAGTPRRPQPHGAGAGAGGAAAARAGLAALEARGEVDGTARKPLKAGRVLLDKALGASVGGGKSGGPSQGSLTRSSMPSTLRPSPLGSFARLSTSPRQSDAPRGSASKTKLRLTQDTSSKQIRQEAHSTPRRSSTQHTPGSRQGATPGTADSPSTVKPTKRALVSAAAATARIERTVRKEPPQIAMRRSGDVQGTARKPSGGLGTSRAGGAMGPPPPPSTMKRSVSALRRPTSAGSGSSIPVPSTLRPTRTLVASTSKLAPIPSGRTSALGHGVRPASRTGSTTAEETETEAHLRSSSAASNTAAEDSGSSLGKRRGSQHRQVSVGARRESWETVGTAGRPSIGSITLARSTASQAGVAEADQSWETDEAQSRRVSGLPPIGSVLDVQTPRRDATPDGVQVASAVAADHLAAALTGLSVSNTHLTPHAGRPARLQAPSSHSSLMYSPLSTTPLRSSHSRELLADLSPANGTPAPAGRRAPKPRQSTTLEEMLRASLPGMRGSTAGGAKSLLESSLSRQPEVGEEEWWYEEGVSRSMREEIMAGGTPDRPGGGARGGVAVSMETDRLEEEIRLREQAEGVAVAQAIELARLREEADATAAKLAQLSAEREVLLAAHRALRPNSAGTSGLTSTLDPPAEVGVIGIQDAEARGDAGSLGWTRAEGLWARCADEARGEREEMAMGLGILHVLQGSLEVYSRMLSGGRLGGEEVTVGA